MNYKDIKEFNQRCEEHPDHQSGMISYGMISQRLQEEIDELREYIEQRTWVNMTEEEVDQALLKTNYAMKTAEAWRHGVEWAQFNLMRKNT